MLESKRTSFKKFSTKIELMQDIYQILDLVNYPEDLRHLNKKNLPLLCSDIRSYLISTLDVCGGHFASNMGVVELTVALHYSYITPLDKIIWDVGHQSYVHKILTGRKNKLSSIRKYCGLAPFPVIAESEYDAFGCGHSSTSISSALGMAVADKIINTNHQTKNIIAVIGDGAMTAGMAFEALNQAKNLDLDILIILNDNNMSISKNVGSLSVYLNKLISSGLYINLKENSKKILNMKHMEKIKTLAKKTESKIKGIFTYGTLFQELGFNYFGPVDGHDINALIDMLCKMRSMTGLKFLHVVTQKGKGFRPSEENCIKYHSVSAGFRNDSSHTSIMPAETTAKSNITYSEAFGEWICDKAEKNNDLVAITPAMCEGSCLNQFAKKFPNRYFDVGIAEQHAITFASGMSVEGLKPIVAIYSTFLQRAYDQLIHDVALQNLSVLFAVDRAGIVGGDGATHQGIFDMSFLRCIPNVVIMLPMNLNELNEMLDFGYELKSPAIVRYPKASCYSIQNSEKIVLARAQCLKQGSKIAILGFGDICNQLIEVALNLNSSLYNMRFLKPIDEKIIVEISKTHEYLITVEEHVLSGGAGSQILEILAKNKITKPVLNIGLPDTFIEHGSRDDILKKYSLTQESIQKSILDFVKEDK